MAEQGALFELQGLCELCGLSGPVERHHLDWHHDHDEESNVRRVCQRCHVALHHAGWIEAAAFDRLAAWRQDGRGVWRGADRECWL